MVRASILVDEEGKAGGRLLWIGDIRIGLLGCVAQLHHDGVLEEAVTVCDLFGAGVSFGVLMVDVWGSYFPSLSFSTVACWDMGVMRDVFFLFLS